MSTAQLEIHLLRKTGHDDIITIHPVMDTFKISYSDKSVNNVAHFVYANEEEVVRYVEDLFYLLVDDHDGFTHIQFSFPCFPAVLYKIPEFDTIVIRRTIRDRLIATLSNWPEKFRSQQLGIN